MHKGPVIIQTEDYNVHYFIEQRRSELLGTEYGILGNKEISSIKTNSICFN